MKRYTHWKQYFEYEEDGAEWAAKHKMLTLLRKLDIAVKYCICRQSLGGKWFFELKLKD